MALELVKLDSGTLPAIANAIRAKTGDAELLLPSQMAEAIMSIQTGVELPDLTNPAKDADVLAGKEYIDADGVKRNGTLVDKIEEVETVMGIGGISIDVESTAGAAATFDFNEPNLQPDNIISGVSIYNVAGSAKTMRVETGTITPAEDSTILELPCTANPKMFIVSATDAAMESIVSGATNSALTSVGTNTAIKTGSVGSLSAAYTSVITVFTASSAKIQRTTRDADIDPVVSIASADGYPWRAGVEYQWTAYYWGDDT